jgi:hypothetical protein
MRKLVPHSSLRQANDVSGREREAIFPAIFRATSTSAMKTPMIIIGTISPSRSAASITVGTILSYMALPSGNGATKTAPLRRYDEDHLEI